MLSVFDKEKNARVTDVGGKNGNQKKKKITAHSSDKPVDQSQRGSRAIQACHEDEPKNWSDVHTKTSEMGSHVCACALSGSAQVKFVHKIVFIVMSMLIGVSHRIFMSFVSVPRAED